jgi:predicted ABC-type sugar transport system permease subunit
VGVAAAGEHGVRGATVRVRRLPVVALLLVVTLGIYYWVWYYRVNRELRDYGRAVADPNPLDVDLRRAMLAVTVGGILIVPAAISVARTFERIVRAARLSGAQRTLSTRLGLALFVAALVLSVVSLVAPIGEIAATLVSVVALALLGIKLAYTQHHVNEIWRRELARAA